MKTQANWYVKNEPVNASIPASPIRTLPIDISKAHISTYEPTNVTIVRNASKPRAKELTITAKFIKTNTNRLKLENQAKNL